jgi:ribosome recycling factor
MTDEVKLILDELKDQLEKAIQHLEIELAKVRAGKANPSMLDSVNVDYYGVNTPLSQVANVNTPDARTIVIQPWEKAMIEPIEKAIHGSNLGFNPQNDGTVVRINVPPLTEERRKELVKKARAEGENTKVGIRSARKDANDHIKTEQKNGLPEDMAKDAEDEVQKLTNAYIGKIDKHLEVKEKEIMTV